MKVTAFILSFLPDACRPFLVISTSSALYSWDQEFLRLAPPLDVVVYSGNKDMRESIRALEFYDQGGCPLFHVLITTPEVIMMVYLCSQHIPFHVEKILLDLMCCKFPYRWVILLV